MSCIPGINFNLCGKFSLVGKLKKCFCIFACCQSHEGSKTVYGDERVINFNFALAGPTAPGGLQPRQVIPIDPPSGPLPAAPGEAASPHVPIPPAPSSAEGSSASSGGTPPDTCLPALQDLSHQVATAVSTVLAAATKAEKAAEPQKVPPLREGERKWLSQMPEFAKALLVSDPQSDRTHYTNVWSRPGVWRLDYWYWKEIYDQMPKAYRFFDFKGSDWGCEYFFTHFCKECKGLKGREYIAWIMTHGDQLSRIEANVDLQRIIIYACHLTEQDEAAREGWYKGER